MNSNRPEFFTARLRVDPLLEGDAPQLFGYRSMATVAKYQSFEPTQLSEAEAFIRGARSKAFGTTDHWSQLAIRLREGGQLVGDLGVHILNQESSEVEFGITIAPDHQRQGIGIEAARGLVDFLFERLGRIELSASLDPRNEGSIALVTSLGMKLKTHQQKSLWFKGEWVDDMIFLLRLGGEA